MSSIPFGFFHVFVVDIKLFASDGWAAIEELFKHTDGAFTELGLKMLYNFFPFLVGNSRKFRSFQVSSFESVRTVTGCLAGQMSLIGKSPKALT